MESGKSILGIDFGLKRVGFAVCDTEHILATPLPVYKTSSMRNTIDYAARVASERGVGGIVVGLPLALDGSESVQSGRVRAFARNLSKVTGLPVELYDERLSTVEADELLESAGIKRKNRADRLDGAAAAVILQNYLDNQSNRSNIMAENQEENVEIIESETITLYDDKDNPVEFNEVAVVEYEGEFYALLQPVEPMEGLGEDEALIFKVVQKDDDTDEFMPVTDEAVLDAVFNEYLRVEAEFCDCEGCDCDCDCEECDDDCDCDCDCGCEEHKHKHE